MAIPECTCKVTDSDGNHLPMRIKHCPRHAAADKMYEACQEGKKLYDYLATATSPLDAAVKYGPDFDPPTDQEVSEMCLRVRGLFERALAAADGKE